MKYLHIDGDDGRIAVEDQLDPEFGTEYHGWVIMVPDDYILSIPVRQLADPYIYEYLLDSHDKNLMHIPTWTERERSANCLELTMSHDVNQYDDEPLDTVNKILHDFYGEKAEIDWRDERECWIWPEGIPVDPPEDLNPTREQVEQHAFEDFMSNRLRGWSLKDLVLHDLEAHEDICDMLFPDKE